MRGLLIVLTVLLLSVTIYLVRYYLAVKSLSKQIEKKLVEESHRRITLKNQPKSLVILTNQIESLFNHVEKTNLVALQEKKTMDMAISNIAHDIRTPLTVASGYAQQSLRSSSEDEMAMEKISKNLLTVSKRLEALLEYRRLTEGAIQPQFQDLDFSQLVVKSILPYYDMFQETGITLDIQVAPDIRCEMDADIFDRLFQNIISNVLKHGKTQAQLTLEKVEDDIYLSVSNMVQQPIQHLDQLTTRFYSENLSDTEDSSGLGLYITKHLVQLLEGELHLDYENEWFYLTVRL